MPMGIDNPHENRVVDPARMTVINSRSLTKSVADFPNSREVPKSLWDIFQIHLKY